MKVERGLIGTAQLQSLLQKTQELARILGASVLTLKGKG